MPTNSDFLADIPFFALLDDVERAALSERLESTAVPAGHAIFRDGDPGDSLYVVRSGTVEISVKTSTGERLLLETAGPGDFFGELSLLDSGPRTATAEAANDVEMLVLDREGLEAFLRLKPAAAMDLVAATARRLRENVRLLHGAASRNVNKEVEEETPALMRAVDGIAAVAGSLSFLLIHLGIFATWILLNVEPLARSTVGGFDSYPFGFLTLCVSLEAIVLSCLLLLSQNRQSARDRVRNEIEYAVNLKAELEIANLHEKVDAMNVEVLKRLESIAKGR